MGGGVVRNRFRQARYDKLKAALVVQRAKQPLAVAYDSDSDTTATGPGGTGCLNTSESESEMLPGDDDGDPEFSDSDCSMDEAEFAPTGGYASESSQKVSPGAGSTVHQGGTCNTVTITAPAQGGVTTTREQEPAAVLTVDDSANSTVQDDPDDLDFLTDVSQVHQVTHSGQVSNFLRQRLEHVANVFHEEQRDHGRMFNFQFCSLIHISEPTRRRGMWGCGVWV